MFSTLFFSVVHGEVVSVNVHIANNSNRTVKKVKESGEFFNIIFLIEEKAAMPELV